MAPANIDLQIALLERMQISDLSEYQSLGLAPQFNILDPIRLAITNEVHRITSADKAVICKAVQWTQTLDHGDFVIAIPALRLKGKKPDELAQEVANGFSHPSIGQAVADGTFVRFFCKTDALANSVLPTILKLKSEYGFNPLLGREDVTDPTSRQKRVVIEYGSPNIAKEFHTGHLRSTVIGGFLAKFYAKGGWEVVSINYLGDWGKQYGVLSQGFDKYGSEEKLNQDPIAHLNDVYVSINKDSYAEQKQVKTLKEKIEDLKRQKAPPKPVKKAKNDKTPATAPVDLPEHKWSDQQEAELQQAIADLVAEQKRLEELPSIDETARRFFKRMTEGDPDAIRNWQRFRDLSISRYQGMFKRLNIHFDDYSGESTVKEEDMAKCAKIMADKGISEVSEGAVKVDFTLHGAKKLGTALVRKKDGTALYLTRDIAANYERYEKYNFDKMLYIVASQQDTHMAQFFKILELLGEPYSTVVSKCQHISFGLVKTGNGETMSTRKGTVVSLDDALNDIGEYMLSVMQQNPKKFAKVENPEAIADVLGISSIIVYDFTGKIINGYNFDKEKMTSVEGDTGPYLQYNHARICSVKREASAKFGPDAVSDATLAGANFAVVANNKAAADLVRMLSQWPDLVATTFKNHEPVTILTYLFRLTHKLSSAYEAKDPVTGAKAMSVLHATSEEQRTAAMALYDASRIVLRTGMEVLGLTPVDAM